MYYWYYYWYCLEIRGVNLCSRLNCWYSIGKVPTLTRQMAILLLLATIL